MFAPYSLAFFLVETGRNLSNRALAILYPYTYSARSEKNL